jgi:hypothetical protein
LLKIHHAKKGYSNLARRTAFSNLPVALKIPCEVHRTEILPNFGIEYVPYIEQGKILTRGNAI